MSLARALVVLVAATLLPASTAASATSSRKRGLCFTPDNKWPEDNYIWTRAPSDLSWYYNYKELPEGVFSNISQADFEFVPMLWGAPADASDTTFLTSVERLIDEGRPISHVMSFNEPDGPADWGGSQVDPKFGARVWVKQIMPLQKQGIRVGLPACTGGWGGIPWLDQFLGNCSELISNGGRKKNCTFDFVPLHWYGNFDGLASHIGTYSARFPNTSIWVTEYNLDNQDLSATQGFYNMSSEYLDRLENIERYSLFAAFRSKVSNVGPNASMLNNDGKLTDIGSWYLGGDATGVTPDSGSLASRPALSLWFSVGVAGAATFALLLGI